MATKNELITRLNQLSAEIGRELDTSGTTADLELRIREAEEELSAMMDADSSGEGEDPADSDEAGQEGSDNKARAEFPAEVRVRALCTLTLTTRGKNGAWRAEVVRAGSEVMLQQHNYASLPPGLVSKIP